jgi:spore coat polysaccharide biosynthesis protein SpsF
LNTPTFQNTIACLIARTVSTRLPLKGLRHIYSGMNILDYILKRLKLVPNINQIYICTSRESVDDILEDVALTNNVNIYRGSASKVIERLVAVGHQENADHLIRITGDNVFTAHEYLEDQIQIHQDQQLDYTRLQGLPVGATAEVMRFESLIECYQSIDPNVSEYLMLYMFDPSRFRCGTVFLKDWQDYSNFTLTVDTQEDLIRTREIINLSTGEKLHLKLKEILHIIKTHRIPNSFLNLHAPIKMPYGKTIEFVKFLAEMNHRMEKSMRFEIDDPF